MSDILTVATLKDAGGFQDWGRLTRSEIIQKTRDWAAYEKDRAEKILNASDEEFDCKIVCGVHVQHLIKQL